MPGETDVCLAATYTSAYIAHAPMEPRVAFAQFHRDTATVWVGTQRPFAVRGEVAAALGLAEEQVRIVVPDFGGGFGGKQTGGVDVEAARLAQAIGRPIKVSWTREEEFRWAYFRPAAVIDGLEPFPLVGDVVRGQQSRRRSTSLCSTAPTSPLQELARPDHRHRPSDRQRHPRRDGATHSLATPSARRSRPLNQHSQILCLCSRRARRVPAGPDRPFRARQPRVPGTDHARHLNLLLYC